MPIRNSPEVRKDPTDARRDATSRAFGDPDEDVVIRALRHEDVDDLLDLERLAFPDVPEERYWKLDQIFAHVERFPEGQFAAFLGDHLVGSCTNMRTTWEAATAPHTWHSITGRGRLETHDDDGDVLYGTEVMVHPDVRRRGIGRRLFEARFAYVRDHDLRAFVTGGRLPGYSKHADTMTAEAYVRAVTEGRLRDAVLTPELKWGLEPLGVLCGYMIDPSSLHHATLVAWENPNRSGR